MTNDNFATNDNIRRAALRERLGLPAVKSPAFAIDGPTVISFSGGRTSAYMLWRFLQESGGTLPAETFVVFANTGKEREETLRFVDACSVNWSVPIHWVEYRADVPGNYVEVTFETASRQGEPFKAAIDKKQRLPNWSERWCTAMLKVDAIIGFMGSRGYKHDTYTDMIGIRRDEGHRAIKGLENAEKTGRKIRHPLDAAGVTKADVMRFWAQQPFDLGLKSYEGNCDLCFMKGVRIKRQLIRDHPGMEAWWSAEETLKKGSEGTGLRGWFDKRHSYAIIRQWVQDNPDAKIKIDAEEYDVECGSYCAPDFDIDFESENKSEAA